MKISATEMNRRNFLKGVAVSAASTLSGSLLAMEQRTSSSSSPHSLARDESYWQEVASSYDRTQGITNLEHGYWGKMANPVQEKFIASTRMVNAQNSYYARTTYSEDMRHSVARVAEALGVEPDEIVLTRNATEAIHNLIRQYDSIGSADKVLYADIDYPSFQDTMRWLADSNGATAVRLVMPARATQRQILELYRSAFVQHPEIKLILLTHASNQHGLVIPVAAIADEARQRGIDVICDSAQSWGLLSFRITDLNVDWAGFNLHKWIGAPVGVGALYMRRGSLAKIRPYPGEEDSDNSRIHTRVHTATSNFASMLTVPAALDFHDSIGGENKEARLRYLRSLWTDAADTMPHIEVLGGADEESWTGMAAFRLRGQTSAEEVSALQKRLMEESRLFTVTRYGLDSGACIRVTPQVFTSPEEIRLLVVALEELAA